SQDTHETLNSFIWGPDGWLYGCHGVFTHSKVGKPGTLDAQRIPINAGIWRYHPVRHEFDIFAEGTSNPWGLDYDQHGEFFVTACVIPHLYHIVPGGRYQRQAGQHFNPYTYEDIKTIADHAHYAGSQRPTIDFDKTTGAGLATADTNALGGGHAHCGLAIYQSSLFPPTYRNQLLFGNLHGHRLVTNYTDPRASSYIGKHGADFLRSNDMHFIPVTQKVGPDGALYVSDWSDQQICHRGSNAVENWDRSNGRIYRISYDGWKPWKGDLAKESDESLAKLAVQTVNEWESRMARRVLMEKDNVESAITHLQKNPGKYDLGKALKYFGLTCLVAPPKYQPITTFAGANKGDAQMRSAIVRSYGNMEWIRTRGLTGSLLESVLNLAINDTAAIVHREIASLLQRLPIDQRKDLATALLKHGEDKDDPMIPLLIWYGIEPLVAADPAVGLQLAKVSKLEKVTGFIYRRMASEEAGRKGLLALAANTKDATQRDALLATVLQAGLAGNKISKPDEWEKLRMSLLVDDEGEKHPESGETPRLRAINELDGLMGNPEALNSLRGALLFDKAVARGNALKVLLQVQDRGTARILQQFLSWDLTTDAKREAIQALGVLQDSQTPDVLMQHFAKFNNEERFDAINTLASTKEGAKALLKAVEAKTVPRTALSPFLVRQLRAFDDAEIAALIKSAWGDVNAPKADMAERVKKYRDLLTPAALAEGDAAKGKMMFMATCGACHKLFGEGQSVGPDITGSNRADLNYLLENVLDPNAVIGKDYQLNVFSMKDGRVMSGVIKAESVAAVKIAMMGGVEFTLPQADIAKREVSKLSTMPEGLFDALPPEMVVDLVKYLQSGGSGGATKSAAKSVEGALEGEALKILETTGGKTRNQGMGGFGNKWSGGSQLWWTGATPGQKLTLALPIKEAGKYTLHAVLTMARDYGMLSITLDGKPITSTFDGYNADKVVLTDEQDWGTHELTAGDHHLSFTLAQPNPAAAPGNMLGLDYVRLEKK
ncbi:MAG: PVC-type heme-binding CxxCH protein, partial [Prosthecobacter sp.]